MFSFVLLKNVENKVGLFWMADLKLVLRKTYAYLKCKVMDNEAYFFNAKTVSDILLQIY